MTSTHQKSCIPVNPISDRLKSLFFVSNSLFLLLCAAPKAWSTISCQYMVAMFHDNQSEALLITIDGVFAT